MRSIAFFLLCAGLLAVGFLAGGVLAVKGKTNNFSLMVDPNNGVLPWPAKGDRVTWFNVNGRPTTDGSVPLADIQFNKGTDAPCVDGSNPCTIKVSRGRRFYGCTPCGDPTIPIGSTTGSDFQGDGSTEYSESYTRSVARKFFVLVDNLVSPAEPSHQIVAGTPQVSGPVAEVSVTCGANRVISASLPSGMPLAPGVKVVWSDVDGSFKDFQVTDGPASGSATLGTACDASAKPPYIFNPKSGTTSTACKLAAARTVKYTITSTTCGTAAAPFVLNVPPASRTVAAGFDSAAMDAPGSKP